MLVLLLFARSLGGGPVFGAATVGPNTRAFFETAEALRAQIPVNPTLQTCDTNPGQRAMILSKVRAELVGTPSIFGKKGSEGPFLSGRRGFFGTAQGGTGSANPTTAFGSAYFLGKNCPAGYDAINSTLWGTGASLTNTSFFLGRQDAYVWMGCTPPPVRYFHFRTFSALHMDDLKRGYIHGPMAGLGETVNSATVNTTGGANGKSPFGKTTVIISTADQKTFDLIADAFENNGIPRSAINLDVLPDRHWIKYLDDASERPGLAAGRPEDDWSISEAEALIMIGRVTGYLDPKDASYSGSVSQAFLLHRRQDHWTPPEPIAALPDYLFRKRGTGKSENVLAGGLEAMRASVISKMAKANYTLIGASLHQKDFRDEYRCLTTNDTSVFYGLAGGFCDMQPYDVSFSPNTYMMAAGALLMKKHGNPQQDFYNWDSQSPLNQKAAETFFFNDAPDTPNPTDRVFVSIGVNHNTFKNVGFNSMMVSNFAMKNGKSSWENRLNSSYWFDDEMKGSGAAFGAGFDNLYALATARPEVCANQMGSLFPEKFCYGMDKDAIVPNSTVLAVERIYLEKETGTGPDVYELLQAELLLFERQV